MTPTYAACRCPKGCRQHDAEATASFYSSPGLSCMAFNRSVRFSADLSTDHEHKQGMRGDQAGCVLTKHAQTDGKAW